MNRLHYLLRLAAAFTITLSSFSLAAQSVSCNIIPSDTLIYVCQGEPLDLNGNPQNGVIPYQHEWYGDSALLDVTNQQFVEFISNIPGTYTLYYRVKDNLGDTALDSVHIRVLPLPIITTSGDTSICFGQSVNLSASGATTIIWFDEGDNLIAWTPSTTVSPVTSTFYTVVGITNGCSNNKEISVDVLPQALINAGPDDSICASSDFSCSAASGSDYTAINWSSSGNGSFSDPSVLNPIYTPGSQDITNGSVTLYITAFGIGPCPDITDSLILGITNPGPIVISGDTVLCEGNTGILSVPPADSYLWSTGEITQYITISPLSLETYSVTVTIGACTITDDVLVQVMLNPGVDAGTDTSICLGENIDLTATGAIDYLWSTGATTQTITVSPISTQIYTVTGTINTCTASAQITVNVVLPPTPVVSPDTSICENSTATLTASGGTSYLWSTGDTSPTIAVTPTDTTTYYVTVSNGVCEANDSVVVNVKPLPIVDLGADTTLCTGTSITLCAGFADSYIWNAGCIAPCITETPIDTMTYSVTATLNGCTASDSITINVLPYIPISAGPDQFICLGDSATLTANGGLSYVWSTGDSTQSTVVSPSTDMTYWVTATTGLCTAWDQVMVFINIPPIADAGPSQAICDGDATTLNASGGTNYVWSTGDTIANISVTPTSSEYYYVTVSDGICSAVDSTFIDIIPLPNVDATDTAYVCPGSSVTLNVSGASNYIWDGGSTGSSLTMTPSGDTIVYVTGYEAGCSNIDSSIVIFLSSPNADAGIDLEICDGDSVMLSALGNDTFLWSTGETTPDIWVSPISNTSYYLTVSLGSCLEYDTVEVIVHPKPTLPALTDQSICPGDSASLTSGGGGTYLWNTGDSTSSISVSPITTSEYSITVTNTFGCNSTDSAIITVFPIPVANAGIDQNICLGTSATLCASGIGSYLWNTGDTSSCIIISPTDTLQYYVTVDNGVCQATDSVIVNVLQNPIADAGITQYIIQGDTTIVNGNGSGTGPYIYTWTPDSSVSNPNDSSSLSYPDITTLYTLFIQDANGCTAWDTTSVIVYAPGIYTTTCGDTTICSGDTIQLMVDVFLGGQAPYTYAWTPATSIIDSSSKKPWVFPNTSTMYYVTVSDSNGLSTVDSIYVTVNETPNVNLGNFIDICSGDSIILFDSNIGNKLWSTGETSDTIYFAPADSGVVYLTVDNNSCIGTDTLLINVNPMPAINVGPDKEICYGDSVLILNYNNPFSQDITKDFSYELIFPTSDTTIYYSMDQNGCTSYEELNITVHPLPIFDLESSNDEFINGETVMLEVVPAIYYDYTYYLNNSFVETNYDGTHYFDNLYTGDTVRVIVTNDNGCFSERLWFGEMNDIPNAFTPDANGSNDLFMEGYQIKIVNRWGQLIYEGKNGWDGTYNGQIANAGTYYYIITLPNPESGQGISLNGSVLLIR